MFSRKVTYLLHINCIKNTIFSLFFGNNYLNFSYFFNRFLKKKFVVLKNSLYIYALVLRQISKILLKKTSNYQIK